LISLSIEKIQELTREHHRLHKTDDELLIAKEVSVRLHSELEKSEQTRITSEENHRRLQQQFDSLRESLDNQQSNVGQQRRNTCL
jgi:hypothetical protein